MFLLFIVGLFWNQIAAEFYMLDEEGNKSNQGLLIADRIESSDMVGTVCDDLFGDLSADVICKDMGYNRAISYTSQKSWAIANRYEIVLDDVHCQNKPGATFSRDCSKVFEHDCGNQEALYLECGCSGNQYILPESQGCGECPEGRIRSKIDPNTCSCPVGYFWNTNKCEPCAENTYKSSEEGHCNACPDRAISVAGSSSCRCEDGTLSEVGASNCTRPRCPVGSAVMHGGTACSCAAGQHWNSTSCILCPTNTYSTANSTACTPCPRHTISSAGSAHCAPCAVQEYWQNYKCYNCSGGQDHPDCNGCPGGYTALGLMCLENTSKTAAVSANPISSTVIGLAVCLLLLTVVIVVLVTRLICGKTKKRSQLPTSVPYHVVCEEEETEEVMENGQHPIYEDVMASNHGGPSTLVPASQYVEQDRDRRSEYEGIYHPSDDILKGDEERGFTYANSEENIYDNI